MKISLRFIVAVLFTASVTMMALTSNTDVHANAAGAPIQKTGSPGDGSNCSVSCHTGNLRSAAGLITSNIPVNGYVGGQTYTITATLVSAAGHKFGFEISPQNSSGALKGTIVKTDLTRTQIIGSGKYITHTSTGCMGTGGITWSFDWIAPVAGTGNVTFYGAFNFTNNNGASTGDTIKLSQLAVTENTTTEVSSIAENSGITIYPNPVQDIAHISFPAGTVNSENMSLNVFDLSGKLVSTIHPALNNSIVDINLSTLSKGLYFVEFVTDKGSYSQKLFKL